MDNAPMHTPGPWEWNELDPNDPEWGACEIWQACDADVPVATMVIGTANARLIAAAPELLDAANKAFDFLGGVDDASEIRAALLNAIAKATQ